MRRTLMEQPDRRFILGLVFARDQLIVLLNRSGTLVTATSINIHKDPKNFIRVIGGLSSMTPEQLGWDMSMKIYDHIKDEVLHSYESLDFEGVYGDTSYHLHWVLDVTVDGKTERYLSVRVLSALRATEIFGRATMVFEVIKFDERFDPKETFALKRYWRPVASKVANDAQISSAADEFNPYPTEGEFYDIMGDSTDDDIPKFAYSHHDITLEDGHTIDILFFTDAPYNMNLWIVFKRKSYSRWASLSNTSAASAS
ncbi:hypothetical protein H0H81_012367 [Sphagnurus paluster]|uniref:Fungal-type protein kinase domain-containing protein n=1 Tax=Sphagnurus paluster TaxID=117069 RepID=A0A9P7GNW9_9AGAR|nr:hypothetical protein H0H81_012367 [Sphagnurus paluster]